MRTQNHSRRVLLRSFLASGCAMCFSRLGMAQEIKMGKKQAQYQGKPNNGRSCDYCLHFIGPDKCMVVEGSISPEGWCKLWMTKQAEDPLG